MEEYVDIDYNGRGLGGLRRLRGRTNNLRCGFMNFIAKLRFKERDNPAVYIDWDVYGRGKAPVHEPSAPIETQNQSQTHLEERNMPRDEGEYRYVDICTVVFPSNLKTIGKKAGALIRRMSSGRVDVHGNDSGVTDCIFTDETHSEEIILNNEEHNPDEQVEEFRDILVSIDDHIPVEPGLEEGEITPNEELPKSVEEPSTSSEGVDVSPLRFKSKLPGEELCPYVEEGHVAEMIRLFSSFESVDEDPSFTSTGNTAFKEAQSFVSNS